jgi:DNA polymerase-3 subunit alpha
MLDGLGTAFMYSKCAADLGQPALALTDHGTMCGVLHHIEACKGFDQEGVKVHEPIKPIVGMEAYFRPDAKVHDATNKEYYHLVLLAKNEVGFRTLMRLTTESYREENFYYKPTVDWEMLEREHEGLIASTSCLSGYLPQMMMHEQPEEAEAYLRRMQSIFGEDLYVEIQPHDFDEQRKANIELVNMSMREGIPLVAAVDAHYPYEEWHDTHDALVMINTGQSLESRKKKELEGEDYMQFSGTTFFMMSDEQLVDAFAAHHPDLLSYVDEAMKNTLAIADRVEVYEISKEPKIPKAASSTMGAEAIVRDWCEEGLTRIGRSEDAEYRARLEFEMGVLRAKRVFDYFVIIGDLVRWAKENGIRVGAGRGSAAGSLVSYLTRITAIDPIGHGLLFERFLNPTRAELPDIDIDFQHNRRVEVKRYLADRWGVDHVAEIVAFQRFGMRAALQSAARAYDVPYEESMGVSKAMDDETGEMDLESMRTLSKDVNWYAERNPEAWKHAVRLEGQVKAVSKHAAGVVVTDRPIYELMPTMRSGDGSIVTQWSERAEFPIITLFGFLKIDVLATDSLTIQNEVIALVKERTGQVIDFEDPEQFKIVEDPHAGEQDVIESFGRGSNLGIFQFESRGISGLLKDIGPTWFGDIAAANALFRPGPLEGGMAFDYAARKNGIKPTVYWHEAVIPYLEETYGLMVYQEQIMQIVQALGGFSLAEADIVRKSMTKWQSTKIKTNKGTKEMEKLRDQFVVGAQAKGLEKKLAVSIWEMILKFSIYGFNKSHSAGYGLQAYQDKWLWTHVPLEWYASLLTWELAKGPAVIREAQGRGLKILPPDINDSGPGFTLSANAIRFGLAAIKHVGDAAVEEIMAHRPFENLDDMIARVKLQRCNARVRGALLDCGAMDRWGLRDDWTSDAKSESEKKLLGFSLTAGGNTAKYKKLLDEKSIEALDLDKQEWDADVMVGGEIVEVKEIKTRKGDPMAFVDLVHGHNDYNCTFFTESYLRYRHFLVEGQAIMVLGQWDPDRSCVRVDNACLLAELDRAMKEAA